MPRAERTRRSAEPVHEFSPARTSSSTARRGRSPRRRQQRRAGDAPGADPDDHRANQPTTSRGVADLDAIDPNEARALLRRFLARHLPTGARERH